MFKRIALIGILALTSTGAVVADDYVAAGAHDWTGFYAGVLAGFGSGESKSTFLAGVVEGFPSTVSINGGLLGATLGANAQFDAFVLGVEGDIAWSGVSGSRQHFWEPLLTQNSSIDWMGTLRGRAGYAVDNFLFYATGGVALAGVTNRLLPVAGGGHSATTLGWTAGLGVEVAATENVRIKAEYLYTGFGDIIAPTGAYFHVLPTRLKTRNHAARLGVNYAF